MIIFIYIWIKLSYSRKSLQWLIFLYTVSGLHAWKYMCVHLYLKAFEVVSKQLWNHLVMSYRSPNGPQITAWVTFTYTWYLYWEEMNCTLRLSLHQQTKHGQEIVLGNGITRGVSGVALSCTSYFFTAGHSSEAGMGEEQFPVWTFCVVTLFWRVRENTGTDLVRITQFGLTARE